jgi:hypothetical protein
MSSQKLRDFLNNITRSDWTYKSYLEKQQEIEDIKPEIEHMSTQDWINFSSKFVESIDGSKVDTKTGLSRKEFLEYIKTGHLPNKEFFDDYWDE